MEEHSQRRDGLEELKSTIVNLNLGIDLCEVVLLDEVVAAEDRALIGIEGRRLHGFHPAERQRIETVGSNAP